MKSCASGLSVRFLSVMIPIWLRVVGRSQEHLDQCDTCQRISKRRQAHCRKRPVFASLIAYCIARRRRRARRLQTVRTKGIDRQASRIACQRPAKSTVQLAAQPIRSCGGEPMDCRTLATTISNLRTVLAQPSHSRQRLRRRANASSCDARAIHCIASASRPRRDGRQARMLPRQPINDGQNDSFRQTSTGSDPQLSCGRIGEKLDVLHALSQFRQRQRSPRLSSARPYTSVRSPAGCGRRSAPQAVLHVSDRPRYCRLGNRKFFRRFRHAARMCHSEEYIQLSELKPASDPVIPMHVEPPIIKKS